MPLAERNPDGVAAEVIATPGAQMSIHEPKLEKLARVSVLEVAPTVIVASTRAGDEEQASEASFPAEVTTVMPASINRLICASRSE
ncbi:hypothetical protein V6O07_15130, partial [Arthrospira platensis SPKY2]